VFFTDSQRKRISVPFFFIDMVLFSLAVGFLDASTVLPEFVGQATDSKVLVGITGILFTLVWRIPQLAAAPAANRSRDKRRWMLTFALPGRVLFFFVAFVIAVFGKSNPGLMLLVFFIAYAAFAFLDGVTALVWVELIGSAVSDSTRGMMFGMAQVVTGVLILVVQGVLRSILGPSGLGYPNNYAIIFVVAAVLLTVSVFFLVNVYEERSGENKARTVELKDYLPYLRRIAWDDLPFRNFLIMRFFLEAAFYMVTPFYIGYETQRLGIPSAQAVGDSLVAVTLGSIGGSLLATWLSHRYSSRIVIWLSIAAVVAGPVLVFLSGGIGYPALLVAFFTIGVVMSAGAPGWLNWLIAYPEPGERPIYSGIANTVSISALIAPVIGGLILQVSDYAILYGVALLLAGVAVWRGFHLVNPSIAGVLPLEKAPVPDV